MGARRCDGDWFWIAGIALDLAAAKGAQNDVKASFSHFDWLRDFESLRQTMPSAVLRH